MLAELREINESLSKMNLLEERGGSTKEDDEEAASNRKPLLQNNEAELHQRKTTLQKQLSDVAILAEYGIVIP